MFSIGFAFDHALFCDRSDFSREKKMKPLRKHTSLSGLSKKSQTCEIIKKNKKIGNERRSSRKRPRFVETICVFEDDNECDEEPETYCEELDTQSDWNSYKYQQSEQVPTIDKRSNDNHLPLRQIFELWGISHVMTNGVGGDGWNIGSQVCSELSKSGHTLGNKIGTPPVRVYNMNDPKVVSIIGSVIARYLITHKR